MGWPLWLGRQNCCQMCLFEVSDRLGSQLKVGATSGGENFSSSELPLQLPFEQLGFSKCARDRTFIVYRSHDFLIYGGGAELKWARGGHKRAASS